MRATVPVAAVLLLVVTPASAQMPPTNLRGTYMLQMEEICQAGLKFSSSSSVPTGTAGSVTFVTGTATFTPATSGATSGQYSATETAVQGSLLSLNLGGTVKGKAFKTGQPTTVNGVYANTDSTLTIKIKGGTAQLYTATYGLLDGEGEASQVIFAGTDSTNPTCAINGSLRFQFQAL
ncbi:MAG TPA: hypothetical protein VGG10_19055 [Rhizomicrobium sp.]|jgi:hypothetical protein